MKPKDIANARRKAGLSQPALAKLCGVSVQSVYYWEHDPAEGKPRRSPEGDHLKKLLKALPDLA